jgi:hypothetical protein
MESTLRDDLLTGAQAIADYLGWPLRRVYHCAHRQYLPIGRTGAILIARKSELDRALSATAAVEAA